MSFATFSERLKCIFFLSFSPLSLSVNLFILSVTGSSSLFHIHLLITNYFRLKLRSIICIFCIKQLVWTLCAFRIVCFSFIYFKCLNVWGFFVAVRNTVFLLVFLKHLAVIILQNLQRCLSLYSINLTVHNLVLKCSFSLCAVPLSAWFWCFLPHICTTNKLQPCTFKFFSCQIFGFFFAFSSAASCFFPTLTCIHFKITYPILLRPIKH